MEPALPIDRARNEARVGRGAEAAGWPAPPVPDTG